MTPPVTTDSATPIVHLLSDDPRAREEALAACDPMPEHERSALAGRLAAVAVEAAAALDAPTNDARFRRACAALCRLRVPSARAALLRVADEGTRSVKEALVHAVRELAAPEGRAVLVHLLSDDDARCDAIVAIGSAPWPEVLPALIEAAEIDDDAAALAAGPVARCGASGGPKEQSAAVDFLVELLDEDATFGPAVDALLRLRWTAGAAAVVARAKRLTKEPRCRKIAGLCLLAAFGDEGNASFLELALSGTRTDDEAARAFLGPLLSDADERVRAAAERTWRTLDLSHATAAAR